MLILDLIYVNLFTKKTIKTRKKLKEFNFFFITFFNIEYHYNFYLFIKFIVEDDINFFREIKEEIRATKREADSKTISKLDSIFIEDIKEVEDDNEE